MAWIQNAKLIIYSGCTTGIESYASDKKTICFTPVPGYSKFEPKLPNSIFEKDKYYYATIILLKTVS